MALRDPSHRGADRRSPTGSAAPVPAARSTGTPRGRARARPGARRSGSPTAPSLCSASRSRAVTSRGCACTTPGCCSTARLPLAVEALDQLDRAEADTVPAGSRLDLGIAADPARPCLPLLGRGRRRRRARRPRPAAARPLRARRAGLGAASCSATSAQPARGWTWPTSPTARPSACLGEMKRVPRRWPGCGASSATRWPDLGEPHRAVTAYDNGPAAWSAFCVAPLSTVIAHLTLR